MKETIPDIYNQTRKMICDWIDEKIYLVHYRMLKFYVRHGMVVENVHTVMFFPQKSWLER